MTEMETERVSGGEPVDADTALDQGVPLDTGVPDGRNTILVADDCAAVLTVTKRMLEDLGYRVLTARNGEQAVTTLDAHQHEIDLVILDMVMPRMGGKETWERLLKIVPDLPVLVCSGYCPVDQVQEMLSEGAASSGFLQKPFDMNELAGKVRQLLKHRENPDDLSGPDLD